MFKEGMDTGVILIAIRPPYGKNPIQRVVLSHDQLDYYEEKWLLLVDEYYDGITSGKIAPAGSK